MLGEHNVWEKFKFYESSVRIPMLIRYPKLFKTAGVINENVNLCDLFATLCDFAGLPCPSGLDSRSLVPLMRGESAQWDNETVSQFGGKHLMIKWDHLKYQYYGEDMPEVLFDLQRDPTENIDFIADELYSDKLTEFRKRRSELGF